MADAAINAFLEKEVVNIVTYRLLSRKLSIHVNAAKNALWEFYDRRRGNNEPIYATFWLSGEPHGQPVNRFGDEMEVDEERSRDWLTRKVLIVGEEDLESAKATFRQLHAFHVYSLSTSPLMSSSQLCGRSREVRELDRAGNDNFARAVGKLVSQQVKRGASVQPSKKPVAPSRTSAPTASTSKPATNETTQPKVKPPPSLTPAEKGKPKAAGKLSWAKAKTKAAKEESTDTIQHVKAEEPRTERPVGKVNGAKRGTKRKSDVISQPRGQEEEPVEDSEPKAECETVTFTGPASENTTNAARVKKGVVLSEDEDEKPTAQAKSSRVRPTEADESDAEYSLRVMMDIDDSLVDKVSKPLSASSHEEEEEEEPPPTDHVDTAMEEDSDDVAPKRKPPKRKEKKDVPIGRNGLRKRRVVKSKTGEEKGYMVTLDYSSYESVEEEEEIPEEQRPRTKAKPANAAKKLTQRKADVSTADFDATKQTEDRATKAEGKKSVSRKPSMKSSCPKERQANGSQKSLASFFGPGGTKPKK